MSEVKHGEDALFILQVKQPAIIKISKNGDQQQVIVGDLQGVPDGVQIDQAKGLIYWTNMGVHFEQPDGSIEVADLDGKNRRLLVGNGAITTPKQLYLDKVNQHLYWCDREGGRVARCRTDGSGLETLLDRTQGQPGVVDIREQCVGITIDHQRNKLYWTQKGPEKGGKGRIFRMNLDIPAGETAANRSDIELLYDNLPEPIDLEIDAENDLLYWTDRGAAPYGNSLNCALITDVGLSDHKVIYVGFDEAIGLALDKTENHAYVSDLGGSVHRIDLNGEHHKVIYQSGMLTGIVLG